MPRIAIIPLSELSHYLPVLEAAAALKEAGHEVVVIGTVDFQQLVTDRGFEFIPAFPELFGVGGTTPRTPPKLTLLTPRRLLFIWRASRAKARLQRSLLNREHSGELSQPLVEQARAELFLVDSFLAIVSVALARYGKPILQFNVTLSASESAFLPPITQFAMPARSAIGRVVVGARWMLVRLQTFRSHLLSRLLGLDFRRELKLLAGKSGFPLAELSERSESALRLRLPELVLCPSAFDFPHDRSPRRYYVGPCTYRGTEEAPQPTLTNTPLIYCAFGTQLQRFRNGAALLQLIWDAFSAQDEFALLLIAPNASQLHSSRGHVTALPSANQPRVLERTAVMITHAGLGSVKECIFHRVPMLALPLGRDQPGNAARIVYHGLGESLSPSRLTGSLLLDTVRKLATDPSYRHALAQQQEQLKQLEAERAVVAVINRAFT